MTTTGPGRPRDIWTRLAIDPIAEPVARRLARRPWVTPNRVTGAAVVLGLLAALCLADGRLRLGGALFLLRFFLDCLDGMVARLQGTSSARGAALDVGGDVVCVSAALAALAWWATSTGRLDPAWFPLAVVLVGGSVWALTYRKLLAARAPIAGDGGAPDHYRWADRPVVGGWVRLSRRLGMNPVPWSVEAETVCFGLLPLLAPPAVAALGVPVACGFLLVALATNLLRIRRIAGLLDGAPALGVPR